MKKSLIKQMLEVLEKHQAIAIQVLDIHKLTDIADYMIIATGNSTTHVKTLAAKLETITRPRGIDSDTLHEWIVVDFNSIIVHIMLPQVREFYSLEKLWDLP